jgi:hypothetical protein
MALLLAPGLFTLPPLCQPALGFCGLTFHKTAVLCGLLLRLWLLSFMATLWTWNLCLLTFLSDRTFSSFLPLLFHLLLSCRSSVTSHIVRRGFRGFMGFLVQLSFWAATSITPALPSPGDQAYYWSIRNYSRWRLHLRFGS